MTCQNTIWPAWDPVLSTFPILSRCSVLPLSVKWENQIFNINQKLEQLTILRLTAPSSSHELLPSSFMVCCAHGPTRVFTVSWQPAAELVDTGFHKILAHQNITGFGTNALDPLQKCGIRPAYNHFALQPVAQNISQL